MTHQGGGPGASTGVDELVALMDRLRSPGGCPWDAAQTHESLAPYALEEAFEVVEAIETGDRIGLREELGDLLLQVVFHARVAAEHASDPFDLDDVARGITAKLVRRHPHVFDADADPDAPRFDATVPDSTVPDSTVDPDAVHLQWERIKQVEKQRTSVLDGIPVAQGALARAQKVLARVRRTSLPVEVEAVAGTGDAGPFGARLLLLAAEAERAGVDAETALRAAVRGLEAAVRVAEASGQTSGADAE